MKSYGLARWVMRLIAAAALVVLLGTGLAWAQSAAPRGATMPAPGTATLHGQQSAQVRAQLVWHNTLLAHQVAAPGCFEAHFPDKSWKEVPCVAAPSVPQLTPSKTPTTLTRTGVQPASRKPLRIGGGGSGSDTDYVATVGPGHIITSTVGSFANVSGIKTISSSSGSNGYFTLQINSNYFNNSLNDVPTCSGAANPTSCVGWQQFVYTDGDDGDRGRLYIQYWMLNYNQNDCPPSWQQTDQSPGSCFFNSPAASIPNPALSTFDQLVLGGATADGGQSYVTLTSATGMYSTHAYDNVLNLSTHWSAAEFNVFGAGNSSEANFNAGVSMDVHLDASVSPPETLSCLAQSATGETTNLFIQTPCTVAPWGSEIQFTEANGYFANGPLITGVSPSSVKATGGDPVTISGMRLANPSSVTFNLVPVPIDTTHSNASQVIIPATPACSSQNCASGGGAVVEIVGPVGPAGANRTANTYGGPIAQMPNVLSVSPSNGPELSKITVTGAGFYPDPKFYIGGSLATNVYCPDVTRNTQCSMTVPAQAGPATVPVSYGVPGGSSSASWTYAGSAIPTIVSINPDHGPQAGGTRITLTGTAFTQTMVAEFNSSTIGITGDCQTSTQCIIDSPRGQGQAYITVQDYTNGLPGSTPGSQSLFTYDVPPPSGTLRPAGGPAAGGTAVEADLTSVSASADIKIQFNFSNAALPISGAVCKTSVLNAANAYCDFNSPPLPTGINPPVAVPVSVAVAGNILQLGSFTYSAPSPGSISPDIGPPTGGTNVTVHVNGLLAGAGAAVDFTFDGTPAAAMNAACTVDGGNTGNSTCTATTPPLPVGETTPIRVPVSVTAQGKGVTVGNFQYGAKVPPPSQCEICRQNGGICSTKNGKFFCACPKSSPTGVCE